MTKGIAILCMLLLHLFCRKDGDVYGYPLLWVSEDTPLVYYIGFWAEICVPLYCLCNGYAHYRLGTGDGLTARRCLKRIFAFLTNFWIICVGFSVVGIITGSSEIPRNAAAFIRNLLLLENSYNGAWWFASTYLWLVILSPLLYRLVSRRSSILVAVIALLQYGLVYGLNAIGIGYTKAFDFLGADYLFRNLDRFLGKVLLAYLIGMLLAKTDLIDRLRMLMHIRGSSAISRECESPGDNRKRAFGHGILPKVTAFAVFFLITIGVCITESAVLMPLYAIMVFVMLHAFRRREISLLLFLGKHSTNIWLVHMFFYLCLFEGFAQMAKYPPFIFLLLIGVCIGISYLVYFVYRPLDALIRGI